MGPRCRAVMIGQTDDASLAEKVRVNAPDCLLIFARPGSGSPDADGQVWPIDPDPAALERLVARLRR